MNLNRISELAAPEAGNDATTKEYVDDKVSGYMSNHLRMEPESLKLRKELNVNNKAIVNVPEPVNPGDAATKGYVDSRTQAQTITENTAPVIIPILIDTALNKKEARIKITSIELNITVNDLRQIVLIFYHPYIKQIEKVLFTRITSSALDLTLTVKHSERIERILINGLVVVLRNYDSVNNGGRTTILNPPAEETLRTRILQEEVNRALVTRQWGAYDSRTIFPIAGLTRCSVNGRYVSSYWDSVTYPPENLAGYTPCDTTPRSERPEANDDTR